MAPAATSMGFILSCIFVACVFLLGTFTLFVQAENIERTALVGCLTLLIDLLAMAFLIRDYRTGTRLSVTWLLELCTFSTLGFFLGRLLDLMLGPTVHSRDHRDSTLGADLAD